jgi:hypothetical protein
MLEIVAVADISQSLRADWSKQSQGVVTASLC